jgi:hypothetical protein
LSGASILQGFDWIYQLKECKELLEDAQKALEEVQNSLYAIEVTSEVLDAGRPELDPGLRHDFLCTRATAFLKVLPELPLTE